MSKPPEPNESRERAPEIDAVRRERELDVVRPPVLTGEAVRRVLRVCPELAGMRLDRFVMTQLRSTSRSRTQQIVALGAFTPAGTPLRKNHRVRAEERVVLWREAWDEPHVDAELPVLYEDDALLAIDKPPHIAVHPTARHHRSTVTSLLAAARPGQHLTLAHRIDRETSGVLLLAKTRAADRAVKVEFEERNHVEKRYLALAWGTAPFELSTCELPMELDSTSSLRVKMRLAAPGAGLAAATTFEVLGRRCAPGGARAGQSYTLFRCTLHTGRQHQIRVHLRALGLPIVGDKLYGPDEELLRRAADGTLDDTDLARLELDRHALHAELLALTHPVTGRRLTITSKLYPDIQAFWDRLEEA